MYRALSLKRVETNHKTDFLPYASETEQDVNKRSITRMSIYELVLRVNLRICVFACACVCVYICVVSSFVCGEYKGSSMFAAASKIKQALCWDSKRGKIDAANEESEKGMQVESWINIKCTHTTIVGECHYVLGFVPVPRQSNAKTKRRRELRSYAVPFLKLPFK